MEVATNTEHRQEGDGLQKSDTGLDRQERDPGLDSDPLGVVVVYGELVQAGDPLTEADLVERTLLPEQTVQAALVELERADAIRVLAPRVDSRPAAYFAEQ